MNWLQNIIASKRDQIGLTRAQAKEFRARAEQRTDFRDFTLAIKRAAGPLKIIAESKAASPSAGRIAVNYDPRLAAQRYAQAGANAVSVLTEENYFLGALDHLRAARDAIELPVLRKDFIVDEAQVFESAANGADAILLIVGALSPGQLRSLYRCARATHLAALVEVHTPEEIQIALDTGAEIIGINNRDLTTLEVDLDTTERLLPHIPSGITVVSESGIRTGKDIARMSGLPIDALLVGEALMRAKSATLRKFFIYK